MIKTRSLKKMILLSMVSVILALGISVGLLGSYIINKDVVERAQDKVKNDLEAARSEYERETESIRKAFYFDLDEVERGLLSIVFDLDYIFDLSPEEALLSQSNIVAKALELGDESSGTRIIEKRELEELGGNALGRTRTDIRFTPKASPTEKKVLEKAMAVEYAKPYYDDGELSRVVYAGKIINRDFKLVDRIRDLVFEEKLYGGKPVGTVTIFQDDVRVSTNVLNEEGKRAVGTRVSDVVYENVVRKGKRWVDRAFVVTDWYLTAYEPIRNVEGDIIGILYVGTLEKPFRDMKKNVLVAFTAIILFSAAAGVIVSFLLTAAIVKPVGDVLEATEKVSSGDLDVRVRTDTSLRELNLLASSFNSMAQKLGESYEDLKAYNRKLASLNKSYIDLIGFVSHELKGILASTILNAYSVRDGFLGMVNFKQRKALDSITRNLDHLDSTVKNFLNLSRIEKGVMAPEIREVDLKEDLVDTSLEAFSRQISDKGMDLRIEVPEGLNVAADRDLMLIVMNNLISNAVKYGREKGTLRITAVETDEGDIRVEVYNDGRPITDEEKQRLFRRFSRLDSPETKKAKGTGLGLFITSKIVAAHKGDISVKSYDNGNGFVFSIRTGGEKC